MSYYFQFLKGANPFPEVAMFNSDGRADQAGAPKIDPRVEAVLADYLLHTPVSCRMR